MEKWEQSPGSGYGGGGGTLEDLAAPGRGHPMKTLGFGRKHEEMVIWLPSGYPLVMTNIAIEHDHL